MKRYKGFIDITGVGFSVIAIAIALGVFCTVESISVRKIEIAKIEMEKVKAIDRQEMITKGEFEYLGETYKVVKIPQNEK